MKTPGKLGYCFGVSQAIEKAVAFAEENGPLNSLGPLAHNEDVVAYLREHRVTPITMEEVLSTAVGMNVGITAHGAPPETYDTLKERGCQVLDCTCPIVRKAQAVVSQLMDGFDVVIFGDPDHQEVLGLNGWAGGAKFVGTFNDLFTAGQGYKRLGLGKRVGVISQTTQIPPLFVDFVTTVAHIIERERFQELRVFNTICPIVAARARKTNELAKRVDLMLVVGSLESANTANLATVAKPGAGADNVLIIQNADQVTAALGNWYAEAGFPSREAVETSFRIGITAGTSTPIKTVNEVVAQVKEIFE
ncbi:hypothetical protein LCGC14_1154400 [marine sediment metagenome]|uniref:4-hydroxy-3-methylbut-2-enyl diphosphate reductase n=1 Tax=marine sediment metagenome TaxID=412755 RepID=A0A0F9LZG8_9ZZZZ